MPTVHWRLLQLADSAFPSGGFAHSAGLEAAFQWGETRTPAQLDAYVVGHLWNVGQASLPFVGAAHDDPRALDRLDAEIDAFLTSHVANRASRTQGRAFAVTCAEVFDTGGLSDLADRARARRVPSHLAPVFGAALSRLALDRHDTLALHLYLALRGVASAGVRLGIVGTHEAQRMQLRHVATLDAVLADCRRLRPADAANVAPLLDIVGATHDSLYARLFQS